MMVISRGIKRQEETGIQLVQADMSCGKNHSFPTETATNKDFDDRETGKVAHPLTKCTATTGSGHAVIEEKNCCNSPSTSSSSVDDEIFEKSDPDYYKCYGSNQATMSEHEMNREAHPREANCETGVKRRRWSRRGSEISQSRVQDMLPRSFPLSSFLLPLRHILHVVILVSGWMLGTVIFYAIEVPAEREAVAATLVQLNSAFSTIADDLLVTSRMDNETVMAEKIKEAYIELLEIEGKWRWSAIQKIEGPEAHYMWTFGSSFFFTFTLFTTVGYGSIYPGTDLGRLIVILYSCFFYPFSLVVIRDLGQQLLTAYTIVYGRLLVKIREARGYLTTEWESISLPWWITAVFSMGFIALCSVAIKLYDDAVGPEEGMSYFISFYFTFVSFTAIGLGDIMPTNDPWAPIVGILIVAGLPLMRVITKMTYSRIERAYFGAFLLIESRLGTKDERAERNSENGDDKEELESDDEDDEEKRIRELLKHNFTVRSLATYISSGGDVYGGQFGRVNIKMADL